MLAPKPGDIVFAPFPYEDQPSVTKERPCLVIGTGRGYVLAAKITTAQLNQIWAYHLEAGTICTLRGRIVKDSYVNLLRRERISNDNIVKIIATLKQEVFQDICELIKEIVMK